MGKSKVNYTLRVRNADEAIDMKNKILANTIDKEEVTIDIDIDRAYAPNHH